MRCFDHPRPRLAGSSCDPTEPGDAPSRDRGAMLALSGPTPVYDGPGDKWGDATRQLPDRLGHYRLIAPRARGGQAEVWEALQVEPVVGRVALKLLDPDRGGGPPGLARLRREALRGAHLDHPAILPVYEFGVACGLAYLVMPLVDGPSLADVLGQRRHRADAPATPVHPLALLPGPLYLPAVVRALAQVARALHAAHAARVAHRDVKPQNILLDRHDPRRVFLIDFGLGRDLDRATLPQLRAGEGTLGYMAPEKLRGRQVDDGPCDIYALGVTLFEAVPSRASLCEPRDHPTAARTRCLARSDSLRTRWGHP